MFDGEGVGWAGGLDGSGDVGPGTAVDRILAVEHYGEFQVEGAQVGVAVHMGVVLEGILGGFEVCWVFQTVCPLKFLVWRFL